MRGAVLAIALTACGFEAPQTGSPGATDAAGSDSNGLIVDGAPDGTPDAASCPGYTRASNGRYYLTDLQNVDWATAALFCNNAEHGYLAIAGSPEENAVIRGLIEPGTRFWIGMTDALSENTWVWLDATLVPRAPQFWDGGQPNDNNGEDCGEMSQGGTWNDKDCAAVEPAVCECDPD